MKKGKLIVFEGGEGSGKTTIANMLYQWCIDNSIDAIKSREPGGTQAGEDIRNIVLKNYKKPIDKVTEMLLFQAARREHYVNIIKPALDAGKVVILDRFILSSIVIQGYGRNGDISLIETLNKKTTDSIDIDCTFILDIDPEVSLSRIINNNREINRIDKEDLSFHNIVRYALLAYGNLNDKFHIINANRKKELIFNDIIDTFTKVIGYDGK